MPSEQLVESWLSNPEALDRALNLADARESLLDFCGLIQIPGAPITDDEECEAFRPISQPAALHHRILCEALQKVETGEITRLMVFMPPGSAKSTYTSVVFPAWFMGRDVRRNVILATYASELARKMGRRCRSVVKQPVFKEVFGVGLSSEGSAAENWLLENGNEYMAGGILSGITGNRADLIVIDDPVKGRQDAESEAVRKSTRSAYDDDVKTRLKPGGRIVIIQTRWHEDDLSGSILPEHYDGESGWVKGRDGEDWYVLCIPAKAYRLDDPLGRSPGDYLWPEWFTPSHWKAFENNPRTWSALYQQRPQPDEGTYFQRAWFKRFTDERLPRSLRYYGTSDYAVSEGKGDYTVLRVWGVDAHNPANIYLVDGWRGQTASDIWIETQLDLIERYRQRGGIGRWYGEAGVIQKAIEPMLTRRMRERRVSCRLEWLPSVTDKPTRARSAQAMVREGRVWIRDDMDGDCFIDECIAFPAGRHDDDVDNLSLIGRAVDQISSPRRSDAPAYAERMDGWD